MKKKKSIFDKIFVEQNHTYYPVNIQKKLLIQKLSESDSKNGPTQKYLQKSLHIRSQYKGIEIQYLNERIQTVFIYFRTKKINKFKGILPFGINQNWTLKNTIFYLGQPKIKSKITTQIIYQNLGIGLVFQGPWSKDDSLIQYCYFFQENQEMICSTCTNILKKDTHLGCKICNLTNYCDKECKQKHQFGHKILCQQID